MNKPNVRKTLYPPVNRHTTRKGKTMKKSLVVLTTVFALVSLVSAAFAQGSNFRLSPGFYDDPYQTGSASGGLTYAGDWVDNYGGYCEGYIASTPDHVMTLTDDFSYLRLFVDSYGEDTTLVLYNPYTGDRFCDDDSHGDGQPEIELSHITAGRWHVYVGSYRRGEWHPYTLNVTEFDPWFAGW